MPEEIVLRKLPVRCRRRHWSLLIGLPTLAAFFGRAVYQDQSGSKLGCISSQGSMRTDHSAPARPVLDNAMHIDYSKNAPCMLRIHVETPLNGQSTTVHEIFIRNSRT